jgi:oligopeptide transport system ATP-binding protein
MKKLQKETGTAILLISHNLGIISDICQRVIIMYAGKIVESGSVEDIHYRTAHPYTKGLLACLPKKGGSDRSRLYNIEGNPVDLLDLPPGCAFASRCGDCRKICLKAEPPQFTLTDGHQAACWLLTEGGAQCRS